MVTGPLTPADIVGLIAAGEDSFTELKASAVSPSDLARELVAFLNGQGGRVLLGVEDDGQLSGLGGWNEERVMNVARDSVDPPAIPTWQRLELSGGPVAVVAVDRGTEKPYAHLSQGRRRYLLRVGTTVREPGRDELLRMVQSAGTVQADLRPVLTATQDDLDEGVVAERFAGRRTLDWSSSPSDERRRILEQAEILDSATGRPTIAGLLCFGRDPRDHLPAAEVVVSVYPSPTVSRDLSDLQRVRGRLDVQVEEAARVVRGALARASTIEGMRREDVPGPSDDTLREVLANAVAHRDYSVAGPVQVRVHPSRIEVLSPGGLPNGVTPEAMRIGVSVRRNPFLVDHLAQRRVVDAIGRGIVLMYEEASALGLAEPRLEVPEGFVSVTIATRPETDES